MNYKESTKLTYNKVAERINAQDSGNWNEKVKKVSVVLTASRTGSSLMKTVLSMSNDVAYLSGEEEPYYIITENAFPFNSDSDSFKTIKNKQTVLDLMHQDLGVNTDDIDINKITSDWQQRLLLQFPLMGDETYKMIPTLVKNCYSTNNYEEGTNAFLKALLGRKSGYYDFFNDGKFDFVEDIKIEEPPFVVPGQKRALTEDDYENKVFVFKTPQDCYRIGIFEQLFPNAEIKYIHLTRGFAQTVNGLMDGWLSDTGFFAHNMDIVDTELKIKDYTDRKRFGNKWWKFDLPPNWRETTDKSLSEVCLNQWMQAHTHILDSGVNKMQIKFENFLLSPQYITKEITEYLGISPIEFTQLPMVMTTEKPANFRWHKRKDEIMNLISDDVENLMNNLNYSMSPDTWI